MDKNCGTCDWRVSKKGCSADDIWLCTCRRSGCYNTDVLSSESCPEHTHEKPRFVKLSVSEGSLDIQVEGLTIVELLGTAKALEQECFKLIDEKGELPIGFTEKNYKR